MMMFSEESKKFILQPLASDQGTSQSPRTVCGNIMRQRQCIKVYLANKAGGLVAHTELNDLSQAILYRPSKQMLKFHIQIQFL